MGVPSTGVKLYLGSISTATIIGRLADVPAMMNTTREFFDCTTHDSGNFREYLPGVQSGGVLQFKVLWAPTEASHKLLSDRVFAGDSIFEAARTWFVSFVSVIGGGPSNRSTYSFKGRITKFTVPFPVEGKLEADFSIQVTGAPTLANP